MNFFPFKEQSCLKNYGNFQFLIFLRISNYTALSPAGTSVSPTFLQGDQKILTYHGSLLEQINNLYIFVEVFLGVWVDFRVHFWYFRCQSFRVL